MQIHLVDGTYELFRAYYGDPAHDGATGLGASLLALLGREGATHVAVAFDHVVESFRNRLFDGYKTGEGIDPALMAQFGPAEDVARALGFVVWPMVEFEADDALAAGAARYEVDGRVERILLCTPDKDLAQCVRGERVVCRDRRRDKILDERGVAEKFGVSPASIPDWLALVGDSADGIPGVPRWGARSAATLLAAYGRIDAIPDDPASWSVRVRGAATLADNLRSSRREAALYRELATLRTDVPLAESVDDLEWRGVDEPALSALDAPRLAEAARKLTDRDG